jgi:hypothetical protein
LHIVFISQYSILLIAFSNIKKMKNSLVYMPVIPALRRPRQEDQKLQASLATWGDPVSNKEKIKTFYAGCTEIAGRLTSACGP